MGAGGAGLRSSPQKQVFQFLLMKQRVRMVASSSSDSQHPYLECLLVQLQQVQWSLQTKQRRIRQVMRSQQRKIKEQRTVIVQLRQQLEKREQPNEKTGVLKVHA